MVRIAYLTCACACILAWAGLYQPALAGSRSRTERQATTPQRVFVPAAAAPAGSSAPVLSGLDLSAIAPAGERLRIIEDEPYVYVLGDRASAKPQEVEAATALSVTAHRADGGSFEARLAVRIAFSASQQQLLLASFDAAADSAYRESLTDDEQRGESAYSLNEVRSPLGLTHPLDKASPYREYLAYRAAVTNPFGITAENLPATPYRFVSGHLKYVRLLHDGLALVTIEFTARDYPHSLTLTENLARAVANRLDPKSSLGERLEYLAYQPEFEPALPFFEGEPIDPRTADLAEQPGEGCGLSALPANGNLYPECTDELPHTPASPQAATLLDVMGPSLYMPGGSRALESAAPFPANAECYNKFVQRYNMHRQRATQQAARNPQRCQAAAAAVYFPASASTLGTASCAASELCTGSAQLQPACGIPVQTAAQVGGGLPPELLARLKLVSAVAGAEQSESGDAEPVPDPLKGGVTAIKQASAE